MNAESNNLPARYSPGGEVSGSLDRLFQELGNVSPSELPKLYRRAANSFHLALIKRALEFSSSDERSVVERLAGLRLAGEAIDGVLGDRPFIGDIDEILDMATLGIHRAQTAITGRRLAYGDLQQVFPVKTGFYKLGETAVKRAWEASRDIADPQGLSRKYADQAQVQRAAATYAGAAVTWLAFLAQDNRVGGIPEFCDQTVATLVMLQSEPELDNSELEDFETKLRAVIVKNCSGQSYTQSVKVALIGHARIIFAPQRSQDGRIPRGMDEDETRVVRNLHISNLRSMARSIQEAVARGNRNAEEYGSAAEFEAELAVQESFL